MLPRSLVWATEIDVLPLDRILTRRAGYLAVRSPNHPDHYWGTFLIFDAPPSTGDRERWELAFAEEFGGDPAVHHRTFAWDRIDGAAGAAGAEFADYQSERLVGLIAAPEQIAPHARANRDVVVRALDPRPGADRDGWAGVQALQEAEPPRHLNPGEYAEFVARRMAERRSRFELGHGAWYVALTADGEVVGSCGILVTRGRGRFQHVDTSEGHRRQGIASRLVVDAVRDAARTFGPRSLVIAADPDYHALGLYESLGFVAAERVCGVCRAPLS